ncbi:MAG: ATP-binding cassette domain-containing protein [Planctomycetota bacterium]
MNDAPRPASEPAVDPETIGDLVPVPETESDTGSETETGSEPESETDPETETETDPDPETDPELAALVADAVASADADIAAATRGGGGASEPGAEGTAAPAAAAARGEQEPVIELRGLTIRVKERVLLDGVDLTVRRGERVLLVGPSGSGKSVLLRLLTGLLQDEVFELEGEARIHGRSVLPYSPERDEAREAVGIVFQDHALLDELTARQNLLFARDHARSPGAAQACERALAFLAEHGIDPDARVGTLSGGQKQRVGVARALARDPELVCFDEPTSALDPRSSRAVASLIEQASASFGKTALIVTHDYAPFETAATRVLFLDPATSKLRELPWSELGSTLLSAQAASTPAADEPRGLLRAAGGALLDAVTATPDLLLAALMAVLVGVVPWGARPSWFLRWLRHYSRITFAGSAIPYNLIAGTIAGFVATYFTYTFLPRRELTEPLILDDILPALGFSLYRIVVPVLVTLLWAGRTGAALASDFGNRVYHHQTQAMRSLGAPVTVYLGTTALWASLVGVLVVNALAMLAAALTSLAVFVVVQPDYHPFYWAQKFWRSLAPFQWGVLGKGWEWVVAKLLVSAGGVCGIAYWIGTRKKSSTAEVSQGITYTVYWATVFVLLVHFVAAFHEFEAYRP